MSARLAVYEHAGITHACLDLGCERPDIDAFVGERFLTGDRRAVLRVGHFGLTASQPAPLRALATALAELADRLEARHEVRR